MIYVARARDVSRGRELDELEDAWVQHVNPKTRADLPDNVPLFIGMKVMVTENIDTTYSIANGSRGTIEAIILDPREILTEVPEVHIFLAHHFSHESLTQNRDRLQQNGVVYLEHLPLYVLIKNPDRPDITLDGLDAGVVPVAPWLARKTFKAGHINVKRCQLPLIPAYSFTIEKSQGQNIPRSIADIGEPPEFGSQSTHLNALYVAFSRSSGRSNIRLLRPLDPNDITKLKGGLSCALAREDRDLADQALRTQTLFDSGELLDSKRP